MGMFDQPTMTPNGFTYQGISPQQAAATKFNNVLTADQIKMLMQNSEQFSLSITQEEMLRAICNHRNFEGTGDALVYDPVTGEAKCAICGYKFRPVEADISPEEILNDVYRIEDILQTIKLMYIDLPAESSKEFFPMIALLDKVPKLFEYAVKNMTKHESYNWQYNGRNMGAINLFNNLQNMFGGMSMMGGMNTQATGMPNMMGAGMGTAPMGGGMPGVGFGYPGASAGSPNPAMDYMAAMMAQQQAAAAQQAGGFSFSPTGAPATDTTGTPATGDTTVTTTITA